MSSGAAKQPLVAIDGPGGAGKSTVARALAQRLGVARLDTGAMYRALTLQALRSGVAPDDTEATAKIAEHLVLELDDPGRLMVDGEDVSAAIRSPEVDAMVSQVAANPAVRRILVRRQQDWIAAHGGGVVEGRDIGSVVAPEADLKVYLTASAAERAGRRAAQARDPDAGVVGEAMARRDLIDSSREHSPLAVAEGAVLVDSTGRSVGDIVEQLLGILSGSDGPVLGSPAPPRGSERSGEHAWRGEEGVGTAGVEHLPVRGPPPPGLVGGRPIKVFELRFYSVCRLVVVGLGRLFYPGPVVGSERLPATGPYVLAPVHRSNLDWMIVARLTKRRLRYLVKDQVWKVAPVGRLIELLGAFPVRRGAADREALATALSVLAGGEPLVIFPEGTRRSGTHVEDVRDGAAYLALRAGVPIVPVGVAGTEAAMPRGSLLPRPARIALVVGEPILAERVTARSGQDRAGHAHVPRAALRATTELLVEGLQANLDAATRLLRAGRLPSGAASGASLSEGQPADT